VKMAIKSRLVALKTVLRIKQRKTLLGIII
jgi:hypothetical protein